MLARKHCCAPRGKLGIVFDIEGIGPVQSDMSLVQTFYELGVRWMLIATDSWHSRRELVASGCTSWR
jgi:membrane dipeptidase